MLWVVWTGMPGVGSMDCVWPPSLWKFEEAAKEGNLEYVEWFFQNAGDEGAAKAAILAT